MAEIKAVMTELLNPGEAQAWKVVWANMLAADTAEAVKLLGFNDRSVQVEGTFGSATITMNGSLDGTNFRGLRDPSSTALTFTTAGLKAVLEAATSIKPATSGGDGTSSLTVTMIFTRQR